MDRRPEFFAALFALFAMAIVVNFPWEMAQARLYAMPGKMLPSWQHCLRASVWDAVITMGLIVGGMIVFRRLDWFLRPGSGATPT